MNQEDLRTFFTTKLLIHPNQWLTFEKPQFLYDKFDEIEVNNIYYKNIRKNMEIFKKDLDANKVAQKTIIFLQYKKIWLTIQKTLLVLTVLLQLKQFLDN